MTTTIESLTLELIARFPTFHLMDVMEIRYSQYWLQDDVKENFNWHLELIKSHYGSEWHLEPIKILGENASLEASKICLAILSTSLWIWNLTYSRLPWSLMLLQQWRFHFMSILWRSFGEHYRLPTSLGFSKFLEFSEFFKLVEIATMQVLGSMEDKQTFSTLSFMKSKLRNHLNEHLHAIVGMYFQTFFTSNTFPYDVCFDDWKKEKPRQGLN
jgi:hypothetical protein